MAKVTLEDVARAAGVSVATVDRVVNRRGGVSADKERAILHAARRLGLDRGLVIRPRAAKRIAVLIQPPAPPFPDQNSTPRISGRDSFSSFPVSFIQYSMYNLT